MELRFAPRFWRQYQRLTHDEQRQVNARLRLLAENPRHPSLQARKWSDNDQWYARASRDLRMFYEVHDEYCLLLNLGHHDIERSM